MNQPATEVSQVPVVQIVPGNNDRKQFDPAKLAELAESIKAHGLAQPITVRPMGDGTFQIVAGERRFRAINLLGWDKAPCIVRQMDDETASSIMLAENTSRADLNPMEEARAYDERMVRFGWDHKKLSEVAGVSLEIVKARLALLQLIPDAQKLVQSGNLPVGHAAALAGLDQYRQVMALKVFQTSKGTMTAADFRVVCYKMRDEQDQDALFSLEELFLTQAAQCTLPTRGKRVRLKDVPTRNDLPTVGCLKTGNTADVLVGYIQVLKAGGYAAEAATLGTVLTALVATNYMRGPTMTEVEREG